MVMGWRGCGWSDGIFERKSANTDFPIEKRQFPRIMLCMKAGRMTRVLQQAIRDSGLNLVELHKKSGVSPAQVSQFMRGNRSLTLGAVEKLGVALGLELRPVRKRKGK